MSKVEVGTPSRFDYRARRVSSGRGWSREDSSDRSICTPGSRRIYEGSKGWIDSICAVFVASLLMSKVSSEDKGLAKSIAALFGGEVRVTRYCDDNRASTVDLLAAKNSICSDVTSFSTVTLSNAPLFKGGEELQLRVEFLGACYSRFDEAFAHVISMAAFCVINSKWFAAPGMIFPDVVGEYFGRSCELQHLFFATPYLWGEGLPQSMELETKTVAWLAGVPISEAEYQYAEQYGPDALSSILEKEDVDACDLERACVFA